jgi:peptidoglycan/xylan/chitin deacetylase (PgdA/CDA1 family)
MLVSSHPFALFDYFRVPYEVRPADGPLGRIEDARTALLWPAAGAARDRRGLWLLEGAPFPASLATDATLREWERELGGRWRDLAEIRDSDGARAAAVRRRDDGTLLLPFDPGDAMLSAWSEAYADDRPGGRPRARQLAMTGYYALRPALPRPLQRALRRAFSRIQARASFPRWPIESGLHDLYGLLFRWLAEALEAPLIGLDSWPEGKRWALVLTHDVEHAEGYDAIPRLRELERELGYRSAWYLVPERDYDVEDSLVADLQADGFEVGLHGLRHDGRDLAPGALPGRLEAMGRWRDRWGAVGFRAPALHRSWDAMPRLGFAYDSSSFDTDPFEPQSGGCCTWLPFHNRDLVELPLTLTMDHTVFVILGRDASLWQEKADLLRERGGMAMLLTHPDYMLEQTRIEAYERFLRRYADDASAWRALPHEVAAWWNRRAQSRIETTGGETRVVGPAAHDARIVELGAD